MLFTELPIAFPWYPKIEQQNRYNENVEPVCDYKLISPRDAMLPFQFYKPIAALVPTLWEIFDVNSNVQVVNISNSIPDLVMRRLESKEYYYYDGRQLVGPGNNPISLPPGYFYSRLVFPNGEMYFSEMFHVPTDGAFNIADDDYIGFIRLEWWNDGDLRPIFYNHIEPGQTKPVFRNVAYLDTFITASEPEIVEDGTRDGEDELIPTFQKAIIPYRITLATSDFLKKALMVMQLHEHVLITTKFGVRSGEVRKLTVQSALEASGGLSIVDILFQQDVAMVKKNCSDNMNSDCPVFTPTLNEITTSGSNYILSGTAPADSSVRFYSLVSPGETPTNAVGVNYTAAQFATGISVAQSTFAAGGYIVARVFSFGCEFGFSNVRQKPI